MNSKLLYSVGALASSAVVAWGVKSSLENNKNEFVECSTTISRPTNCAVTNKSDIAGYENVTERCTELILKYKQEIGAPGIVVGVSVNGKPVWKEGFGFADVENNSPCHADTVMRIASISKSMTMAIVAKLWEDGKLDLDKQVQAYVPNFPSKTFEGVKVDITTRQLVSHLSGIRHYVKKGEEPETELSSPKAKQKDAKTSTRVQEVYNKNRYESVKEALTMFQDDELLSKPGTKYLYTTHGWTLVSAVVEGASQEKFTKQAKRLFVQLGLHNTRLDEFEPIIYNRAKYYKINKHKRLVNVPFTDNSYKWAGGGFLSTVGDLLKFGNIMLYSYQWQPGITVKDGKLFTNIVTEQPTHPVPDIPPGYLRPETVKALWTPVPLTKGIADGMKHRNDGYGMGWQVVPLRAEYGNTGGGDIQSFRTYHTGAAVGASSVLHILPQEDQMHPPPRGICVAILVNMQNVGLYTLADDIAHIFAGLK